MASRIDRLFKMLKVPPGKKISLAKDHDPGATGGLIQKKDAVDLLAEGVSRMAEYQNRLYAQNTHSLLIIFQAMDAAGKDSTIRHVMSGLNPQGTQVYSFKAPSADELDQTYLWRGFKALPGRGNIGIFNRSYYEEVLIVRVHPEILERQQLPSRLQDKKIWRRRFQEINNLERYLVDNGTIILKFFLNISKDEQKKRFLKRINRSEKNWKFSMADVSERRHWDQYQKAYEHMLNNTSTKYAPWYVVPADHKWFTRIAVAGVIYQTLKNLNPAYPAVTKEHRQDLLKARKTLLSED